MRGGEERSFLDIHDDLPFQITFPDGFSVDDDSSLPVSIIEMGFTAIVGPDIPGDSAEKTVVDDSDFLGLDGFSVPMVDDLDGIHDSFQDWFDIHLQSSYKSCNKTKEMCVGTAAKNVV